MTETKIHMMDVLVAVQSKITIFVLGNLQFVDIMGQQQIVEMA
jgi:hypothetical protein